MIKFTIVGGKLVLDPNIVLFKVLQDLYDAPEGQKFLQVIFYTHSKEGENPFRDLDRTVSEENILRVVFNKSSWKELKVSKEVKVLYDKAESFFIEYNSTPETRLLDSIDRKLDEISDMLNTNVPIIEASSNKDGKIEYTTNLTIMLNAFSKIETIVKSKTLLQSVIAKSGGINRVKADASTSFRERGSLDGKK